MKAVVRQWLAFFAYWLGVDALMYWLNRKAKRIITFHNVLPGELQEAGSVGVSESLDEFVRKVDEVAKRFHFSTDLHDPSTVTITFDDGTLNEYEVAGEALRARQIPAILFVAGDVIGAGPERALVTDKILVWNQFAPDEAVKQVFGVVIPRDELWLKYVQPGYREDGVHRGRQFLAKLEAACPVSTLLEKLPEEWSRLRLSGVTQAQLDDLRARGWTVGWHTWSHYPLGMLNEQEKRKELEAPAEYRSVVLCYPYGDIGSIGVESIRLAEKMGYPMAVSNDPDFSPHRGRYFRLRIALPENKYELHMALSGLKYFIKFGRFLPRM